MIQFSQKKWELEVAHIESIQQESGKIYIGVVDYDDCSEVVDNFDGEFENGRYVIANSKEILAELYRKNLLEKGEMIALENCDYLAFNGAK